MSLKINVLIISMVVLTIFVKMVPAPETSDNVHYDDDLLIEMDSYFPDAGYSGDVFMAEMDSIKNPNKNFVTQKSLNKIKDMYKTEILKYCKKNQIQTTHGEPDLQATLLYFKNVFNDFNRCNWILNLSSDEYISLLISMKEECNEELKKRIDIFKKIQETELKKMYEISTFCPLPTEIEDEFFFEQLRLAYNFINARNLSLGNEKVTEEAFITKLEEDNITQNEMKYNTEYEEAITFTFKWQFYGFNLKVFHAYLFINKSVSIDINTEEKTIFSVNGVDTSMTILETFLHYFKENLDNYYNQVVGVKIDKLTGEQRIFYYKRMLRAMIIIYNAYNDFDENTVPKLSMIGKSKTPVVIKNLFKFVELMIFVAKTILESNKTKKIHTEGEVQWVFNNESYGIFVKDNYYKCIDLECPMPDKVDFKDILDYLIVKNKKFKAIAAQRPYFEESEFEPMTNPITA